MNSVVQSWTQTAIGSVEVLRLIATKKMMVAMFWDSVPKGIRVTGETYKGVLQTKFLSLRLFLIGQSMFTSLSTTPLKSFLMLRTYLTLHQEIFGCFQRWRTLSVVAHFQIVLLSQQQFSSGPNWLLKKRLLQSCYRGVVGYNISYFLNDKVE